MGVLTAGGDCPGLNAVIRAVVKTSANGGAGGVLGIRNGFDGLIRGEVAPLDYNSVSNILTQGGSILGMSGRGRVFQKAWELQAARRTCARHRLSGLIAIGGEGTLTVADFLDRRGIRTLGVPKTIDNDVAHTDQSFGFDSALSVATEAVDRLHTTAVSHHRIMVLEVMGRSAGWIALFAGLAGGGDVILIPELPFEWEAICRVVTKRARRGRKFSIVVVAEGAKPKGGQPVYAIFGPGVERPRLGGVGVQVAQEIEKRTGLESRATILGYVQRGGSPTPFDRLLATRFGHAAADLAARGRWGRMVRWKDGSVSTVPLSRVSGRARTVPTSSPWIEAARDVGTAFADGRDRDW
jgi:6-phosphofructokinase 1